MGHRQTRRFSASRFPFFTNGKHEVRERVHRLTSSTSPMSVVWEANGTLGEACFSSVRLRGSPTARGAVRCEVSSDFDTGLMSRRGTPATCGRQIDEDASLLSEPSSASPGSTSTLQESSPTTPPYLSTIAAAKKDTAAWFPHSAVLDPAERRARTVSLLPPLTAWCEATSKPGIPNTTG